MGNMSTHGVASQRLPSFPHLTFIEIVLRGLIMA